MGDFADLDVHTRLGGMAGRPAEEAFLRWMTQVKGYLLNQRVFRYGVDQWPTNQVVATMDAWERHTPDFLSVGGHFWEVEGTDAGAWTFKKEKLAALTHWHTSLTGARQLRWFLYHRPSDTAVICSHDTVLWAINQAESEYSEDLFDGENKPGWRVPLHVFLDVMVACSPFEADKLAERHRAKQAA